LPRGFDVNSPAGLVELGLGALVSLPFSNGPADRSGVAVGTEIGYSLPFAESDWRDGTLGPRAPSYTGPGSGVQGAVFRLLLRYQYDAFDTHRSEVTAVRARASSD
jgi:hypothetical protein